MGFFIPELFQFTRFNHLKGRNYGSVCCRKCRTRNEESLRPTLTLRNGIAQGHQVVEGGRTYPPIIVQTLGWISCMNLATSPLNRAFIGRLETRCDTAHQNYSGANFFESPIGSGRSNQSGFFRLKVRNIIKLRKVHFVSSSIARPPPETHSLILPAQYQANYL